MGRNLSEEQLIKHKDSALKSLDRYMTALITDGDRGDRGNQGKSDKLSYWLEDWITFLEFEAQFSPLSLRRYKRGEIIKAHLGYNVGSEEGGLHYCVVVDRNNSVNSPVVTIVPLTSVKQKTDLNHLHKGNIYLGNELFRNLNSKILTLQKKIDDIIIDFEEIAKQKPDSIDSSIAKMEDITKKAVGAAKEAELLTRMHKEVQKMKIGSIALVSQIRTISKIRIYDPKTNHDVLSNVKLSNEKLDLIDTEIIHNFTGQR
ncbi:MAG TPA: growth inhibitor PemK [Lachnospiraceae bacterium]|jgi:mRNA-degrading endonuclease toxin of MazEF toxin-antitoxin module|uniref:PemK-like, MazF-like toxin of type II toxin-antitoxin system n=1 Tax=Muricomes intestini TaxID=1796634 RepID=A0A4R3K730_9FIRM|nr:type II toxin-antitoxin system PemK/MazF family toxin [Muricomes intestini]TCS78491.1 PemK-like, MazF-like toxin of type II toxin-antitoxin system [Muricomes intestini]HCR83902.1 growth inhibitor PemK [Lachnospiraceae bacterium]